jgi:late competence protein required for DNA uptake (superfamily II DNA/RNA helicase)
VFPGEASGNRLRLRARASFRSGEIRVLDSTGSVERTIAFNETDRKLAESEVNSNRSVSLGRQGRLDYVNFGTLCSPHLSRCPKFFFPDRLDTLQLPVDDLFFT